MKGVRRGKPELKGKEGGQRDDNMKTINNYAAGEEGFQDGFYVRLYNAILNGQRSKGKPYFNKTAGERLDDTNMPMSLDIVTCQNGRWYWSELDFSDLPEVPKWGVFLDPAANRDGPLHIDAADRLWLFGYYLATKLDSRELRFAINTIGRLTTVDMSFN